MSRGPPMRAPLLKTPPPTTKPVFLNRTSAMKLAQGNAMFLERSLMNRTDVWHMVKILKGARYSREAVLQAILALVEPSDLIPITYQVHGEDTVFIARNCGPALDKLCKSDLMVKLPTGDVLEMTLTLAHAHIQAIKITVQSLLLSVMTSKFDSENKTLDLSAFHKNRRIAETVYCPLSQLRTLSHVLKIASNSITKFNRLNLRSNDLTSLTALENSTLIYVKQLDLRFNQLLGMETLTPLRSLHITELWLDGNPLCENYSNPAQYIESAKRYCPYLIKLDGVYTGEPGLPCAFSSYFKNPKRKQLIEQFVKHFFTLLDSKDKALIGLYEENAVYSMTSSITLESFPINLGAYNRESRNLLQLTHEEGEPSYSWSIFIGEERIIKAYRRLPSVKHVISTFTLDLMYDDGRTLMVSVCGLFNLRNSILSFSRTFVLNAKVDNEYKIANDHYQILNGPEMSADEPLSFAQQTCEKFETSVLSAREKDELANELSILTTMSKVASMNLLERCCWDLRKSITVFMSEYSAGKIPENQFAQDS